MDREGERPGGEGQDQDGAADDGDQLVHLPCGLPLPDVGHLGLCRRGGHPGGLLRLGHHLEVWCGLVDLSDYLCQVEAGVVALSLEMIRFIRTLRKSAEYFFEVESAGRPVPEACVSVPLLSSLVSQCTSRGASARKGACCLVSVRIGKLE